MSLNLDGLWTAEFSTRSGTSGGVAVLNGGQVRGGDSSYYYVGSYDLQPGIFTAQIQVAHHFGPLNSLFGPLRTFNLDLRGSASERLIIASGALREFHGQNISIKLQFIQK